MPQSIDDITLNSYVNQLRNNVPLPRPDPRFSGPSIPSELPSSGTFVDYLPGSIKASEPGTNPDPSAFLHYRGYSPTADMGIMKPPPYLNPKPLDAVYGGGNHRIMTRAPSSDFIDDAIKQWLDKHPNP